MDIKDYTVGFELEYDDVAISTAEDALGQYGEVKEDGSIDDGYELASPIHTGKEFLGDANTHHWDEMMATIVSLGSYPGGSHGAGHHIHVGKTAFTFESAMLINRFFVGHPVYLQQIGGREFNSYCYNMMGTFVERGKEYYSDKYRTMNLSPYHKPTVEYRFFNTTNKTDIFLKNMQFALGITAFGSELPWSCREEVKEDNPIYKKTFHNWLQKHKDYFPHLIKFVKDEGLGTFEPEIPAYKVGYPEPILRDRFNFLCIQISNACRSFPVVPVATFKAVSLAILNPRSDIALCKFINEEITKAFMSKAKEIQLPPLKQEPTPALFRNIKTYHAPAGNSSNRSVIYS